MLERARILIPLYRLLKERSDSMDEADRAEIDALVREYTSSTSPHTNCARNFVRLFEKDRQEAMKIYHAAVDWIKGIS